MMFPEKWLIFLPTIRRLGIRNVAYIAWYRNSLRWGWRHRVFPIGKPYAAHDIFQPVPPVACRQPWRAAITRAADDLCAGTMPYFAWHRHNLGNPPDWFLNPWTGARLAPPYPHWQDIHEFNIPSGDIKIIWEPSRFAWLLILARAYRVTANPQYLKTLNQWIHDWIQHNPANQGVNWKCGQECAIRLGHALLTAKLLDQERRFSLALVLFVTEHAARIEPNLRYAMAQDNNHGTSEAAGLWLAGAWLNNVAGANQHLRRQARRWIQTGRYWLENRLARLVASDGVFAQYSVTYQRMLLDTLSMIVYWQRLLGEPPFSSRFMDRAKAALHWLFQVCDPISGDAPNGGANDGTLLFPLHDCGYRDFRPSVQLAAAVLTGERIYAEGGAWDEPLFWLSLPTPKTPARVGFQSMNCNESGYAKLQTEETWALIRYPRFHFRPSHADALHLDIWSRGRNVVRDAGSYCYYGDADGQTFFPTVRAHSTAQFDGHDQMPRLSRFLYGAWLIDGPASGIVERNGECSWEGAYRNYYGANHRRRVVLRGRQYDIYDSLSDYYRQAVLRWRLLPVDWRLAGPCLTSSIAVIEITSHQPVVLSLGESWESLCYWQRSKIPVLTVTVPPNASEIHTRIILV